MFFKMSSARERAQRGFTLLEVLLSLGIAAGLLLYYMQYQAKAASQLKSNQLASSLQDAQKQFTQYLLANRTALTSAMTDGTGASSLCVINANVSTGAGTTANNTTLHTCAVDFTYLKYLKAVPANYGDSNVLGQRWTAIYRLVYADFDNNAGTPDTTDGSIEMLVVGAQSGLPNQRSGDASTVALAANLAGYNAGFIPTSQWGNCTYNSTAKTACSSSGGWKADLSKFLNTP